MDMGKVTIRGRFLIAGILAIAAAGCSEKDDGITKMGKYTEVQDGTESINSQERFLEMFRG